MTKEEVTAIVKNPYQLDEKTFEAIQTMVKTYPYFQIGLMLAAKYLHDHPTEQTQPTIQKAAIYATNRQQLKRLLETPPSNPSYTATPSPTLSKQENSHPTPTMAIPTAIVNKDIPGPASAEPKQNAVLKNKQSVQTNIIDDFIKKGNGWRSLTNKALYWEEKPGVDLTESSTRWDDTCSTENLARVMAQQGNLKRAAAIYETLQKVDKAKKP